MVKHIYRLLDYPWAYKLVCKIFEMGGRAPKFLGFLDELFSKECQGEVLEIGSGTCQFRDIYLKYVNNYIATDINLRYLQDSQQTVKHIRYVACDATVLPFPNQSFARVFALYLFHHLTDEKTLSALKEMHRCIRPGGKIIIMDNFLPELRWDLCSWAVARLDRGQYIRSRMAMEYLIQKSGHFQITAMHQIPGSWPYVMSLYMLTTQNEPI
jgi:ubiquinone/menaquinone biosynthesis C-methylase UbiE